MDRRLGLLKKQILAALRHPEAEEGLYLDNFYHLHEEDERPAVQGTESEIMDTLVQLVEEGKVIMDSSQKSTIFRIKT